jgi:transposase
MRVTTFFKKIIRLKGTIVESVHVRGGKGSKPLVQICVRSRRSKCRCGNCGKKAVRLHGVKRKMRRWRHLGIFGIPVELVSCVFRVLCVDCGVRTMAVPWARVGSIFTRVFEDEVAWFMRKTNQQATATYFGISWPTAGKIARRVVAEKLDGSLLEDLHFLGVDEITYGWPRKFLTIVVDHSRHRVVWAAPGQNSQTLAQFFEQLGPDRCAKIHAVSIDMDPAFEKAIAQYVSPDKITYDRFHVVQLPSRAVDQVRRQEVARSDPGEKPQLKSSRYALLKHPWNLKPAEKDKLSTVQEANKKIYRAYLLKETFQTIYDAPTARVASDRFSRCFAWARRSALDAFKSLALTIKNHLPGILRFFESHLTNSPVEGMNSKVRMISHRAFGFRSSAALIVMIQLCCSGIQLVQIGA